MTLNNVVDGLAYFQAVTYMLLAVLHCIRRDYQLGLTSIFYSLSIVTLFILWRK